MEQPNTDGEGDPLLNHSFRLSVKCDVTVRLCSVGETTELAVSGSHSLDLRRSIRFLERT